MNNKLIRTIIGSFLSLMMLLGAIGIIAKLLQFNPPLWVVVSGSLTSSILIILVVAIWQSLSTTTEPEYDPYDLSGMD